MLLLEGELGSPLNSYGRVAGRTASSLEPLSGPRYVTSADFQIWLDSGTICASRRTAGTGGAREGFRIQGYLTRTVSHRS